MSTKLDLKKSFKSEQGKDKSDVPYSEDPDFVSLFEDGESEEFGMMFEHITTLK